MKIGFIGAGKVCTALSHYFKREHNISGIYSRSAKKADKLAKELECSAFTTLEDVVSDSELIFISTGDDQISEVATFIAALDADVSGKSFAHLSGSLSSSLLSSLKDKGSVIFSLHPLQAFSDPKTALECLPCSIFTVEGSTGYHEVIDELLYPYPNETVHISADDKCRYHIAAVMLSNYLVSLYGISEYLLDSIGIDNNRAKQILLPLLDSTAANIKEKGFAALTGPLQRSDIFTIRNHLKDLSNEPDILNVYRTLANETLNMLIKAEENSENSDPYSLRNVIFESSDNESEQIILRKDF